jgi:NAD(P)-dependent dehydrogenase (short-subunit alcohol dehydrogenase family)
MSGEVAVVTGGTGNIGRGVCRALTKAGATVVALDVRTSRAPRGWERSIECDVTDAAACASAVNEIVSDFGGVNTLVNLAQRFVIDTDLLKVTDDDMRVSFESGPIATLRMMQLCYPHIKTRGGGAIINFASEAGTAGHPGMGAYAAAKEAIRGITKVAALEWGSDNIRVNAICPIAYSGSNPDHPLLQAAIARSPMGRLGDPETDIGSVVVFLAGAGTFITGRTLHVDGGTGTWR